MTSTILTQSQFPKYLQENRSIQRYDSSIEAKLPHPWWNVDHAGLHERLKEISRAVITMMNGIPDGDNELKHLKSVAEGLPQVQRGAPVTVALVGAQGAGKSLLINALFDCDGLSLTGADGAACTSAVIEYKQYPRVADGGQQFLAEIQFLDAKKKEEMIKEHTRSYRYYHQDEESDDESEKNAAPRMKGLGQDEADRKSKDTAEDIFHTLFGGKEQFQREWASCDHRTGEFVKLCQLKCKEITSGIDVSSDHIATYIGKDAKDLLRQIKPFMTKVRNEACLWPLVDRISIRFHSPVLEQGLVIVDLPGWGDINISRTRHADEIKDDVDVEFIVADTIRFATDDAVINNARSAIINHGPNKVKLVATKIDAISPNQLAQCSGHGYDHIKDRIKTAQDDATQADDEDDLTKSDQLSKYVLYLERKLKQRKIEDRAKDITQEMKMKLEGSMAADESVQCIHVSASDYMQWICRGKVIFRDQPALPPDLTGIPAIRQQLYDFPADQNLANIKKHILASVPAFLEKISRVVSDVDRDAGYNNIADDFDHFRKDAFLMIRSGCKGFFHDTMNKQSSDTTLTDANIYKRQVDEMIKNGWLQLKCSTWNKVLKSRGSVIAGTSRAKGLELGCNWSKDLSDILAPVFRKWCSAQMTVLKKSRPVFTQQFDSLFNHVLYIMNNSPASVTIIEKAKRNWKPLRRMILAKTDDLLDVVEDKLNQLTRRATMEDGRENSVIPTIIDDLFDVVFNSSPGLKEGSTGKKKYVTPKLKYQKNKMYELFLHPNNHIVDRAIGEFQQLIDTAMNSILEKLISSMSSLFDKFSDSLRAQAPISYTVTAVGEKIRSDLRELLPKLQEQVTELRSFLPKTIKNEDDNLPASDFNETKPSMNSLSFYLETSGGRNKREAKTKIKSEPGTKRLRIQ